MGKAVLFILGILLISSVLAVTSEQYNLMDEMFDTHINYFLNSNVVTSYGLPSTAFKVGDRGRYGYSNPTEWGYLLQAYIAASERGIITQNSAMNKINKSLSTMLTLQNTAGQNYKKLR